MRTSAGWRSIAGRRAANQDALVARTLSDGRELMAIADGMGGHQGGEVASRQALEKLVASLEAGRSLRDAMTDANAAVYAAAQQNAAWTGMGTTLVAMLRSGDSYHVANVGDSRAYCVTDAGVRQLTNDHSFLAEALRAGRMSAAEARRSRWRNALTRAIGTDPEVEIDIFGPIQVRERHTIVLCSDGLHGSVSDEWMLSRVREHRDAQTVAADLVEQAFRNGSKDNITVAVLSLEPSVSPLVVDAPGVPHIATPFKLIYEPERTRKSFLRRLLTLFT